MASVENEGDLIGFWDTVSNDTWSGKIYSLSYLEFRFVWYSLLVVFGGNKDLKDTIFILLHWVGRHIPTICANWCQLPSPRCK